MKRLNDVLSPDLSQIFRIFPIMFEISSYAINFCVPWSWISGSRTQNDEKTTTGNSNGNEHRSVRSSYNGNEVKFFGSTKALKYFYILGKLLEFLGSQYVQFEIRKSLSSAFDADINNQWLNSILVLYPHKLPWTTLPSIRSPIPTDLSNLFQSPKHLVPCWIHRVYGPFLSTHQIIYTKQRCVDLPFVCSVQGHKAMFTYVWLNWTQLISSVIGDLSTSHLVGFRWNRWIQSCNVNATGWPGIRRWARHQDNLSHTGNCKLQSSKQSGVIWFQVTCTCFRSGRSSWSRRIHGQIWQQWSHSKACVLMD